MIPRNMPRRKDDMANASLYWVKRKKYFARQKIQMLEQRFDEEEGRKFCRIWLQSDVIAVEPYKERNFQGWRYLRAEDSPPDCDSGHGDIENELKQLGLID